MSNVNRLNGRILTLERERDELVRDNFRYRDKLLELAHKCGYCGGAGTVPNKVGPTLSCPVCGHIRKVLE